MSEETMIDGHDSELLLDPNWVAAIDALRTEIWQDFHGERLTPKEAMRWNLLSEVFEELEGVADSYLREAKGDMHGAVMAARSFAWGYLRALIDIL